MSSISTPLNTVTFLAPPPNLVEPQTQIVGKPGINQYFYWVIAHYPIGSTMTTSPAFVGNAPNTLDASNYVLVFWDNIEGATAYDVVRSTSPLFPTSTGNFGVAIGVTSSPVRDTSNVPGTYNPNTFRGLPFGSPVMRSIVLNNRDFTRPTLVLPNQTNVDILIFPDGSTITSGGGAGQPQTPWASDINAAGFKLNNVSQIQSDPAFNLVIGATLDISLQTGAGRTVSINNNASIGGTLITTGVLRTNGGLEVLTGPVIIESMPTTDPGPGSNQLWADPADGNRVKWSA